MSKPSYIVRIRDAKGMKRIEPPGGSSCTLDNLRKEIHKLTSIAPEDQLLSLKPPIENDYIVESGKITLSDLHIKHGDIIYLVDIGDSSSQDTTQPQQSSGNTTKTVQLTPQCQHGPRGRCLYCDAVPAGVTPDLSGKCNHSSNATCIHCSKYVQDKVKESKKANSEKSTEHVAGWLCNHPTNVFCPKCLPAEKVDPKTSKTDVHIKPFKQVLHERKAMCRFRHDEKTTCAMCAPPHQPSFTGKPNCTRGHQPWPRGVCTHCAPPTAVLRMQEYRHVDGISIPSALLENFYRRWSLEDKREVMRCALLFGRIIDETSDIENPLAVRTVVSAIYEPPQKRLVDGVRFLKDDQESVVMSIAAAAGLVPVGCVITANPRPNLPEYGGKIFMTGTEVCIAAALQQKFLNGSTYVPTQASNGYPGFSQFTTVIFEHGEVIEPKAYMVSDQCQALVRDGCLLPGTDPYKVRVKPLPRGELGPKVVYHDRPLENGAEFLPDNFLVKIRVMTSKQSDYSFAYYEFPSRMDANDNLLKSYLKAHKNEGYGTKLSDFNILVYLFLRGFISESLVNEIASIIGHSTGGVGQLPQDIMTQLDSIFAKHKLWD